MKQNNENPSNRIAQEFLDSGSLYYLEAKYLTLTTKAVQESNYSKVLPDRMGCRGKAGKIAAELVTRFLNKYGLVLTYESLKSEYSSINVNRDTASTLLDIAKLEDKANPLHELVKIMKNTERHQYHHPKLVQALMNKVPQLLNDETKAHFNKILTRATVAKSHREPSSKRNGHLEENLSPINKVQQNIKNDSLINSRDASLSPTPNQITTTIQQPLVFLEEGTDDESNGKHKAKQQNVMLMLNLNIKNSNNPDEQAQLEIEPPSPNPTQITATAVLLPSGDDYQKISSSNGTNQLLNEEEEENEQYNNYQDRNINNMPNENQDENEYEYEYEYEEVEENEIPNPAPIENEKALKEKKGKRKNSKQSKKKGKSKKKNSIDPQIQQQLEEQKLIIQKLQELNQTQQQQQYEQQQKLLQQIQQQELQQQQLQQQLEQQQIQNEINQQKLQQQLQEQQFQQQIQQEQINQQLQPEPLPKTYRPSPGKFTKKDLSPLNASQTGATSGSSLSFIEEIQDKNDNNDASSYIDNTVFPENNKPKQETPDNNSEKNELENEPETENSTTSIADFIDEANIKKRNMKPISNALDNLLKIQKQGSDDDESTIIIPVEKKKTQLYIETFSMPEVPFNENSVAYSYYSERYNSDYSEKNDSDYSEKTNSDYSIGNNVIDEIVNNENEDDRNYDYINRNINIEEEEEVEDESDNLQENKEEASSQATSVADKEYPPEVIRSIKQALSPNKEKQDSFETTETAKLSESIKNSTESIRNSTESIKNSTESTKRSREYSRYSTESTRRSETDYLSETDYYSADYYSTDYYTTEDYSDKKAPKQVNFKLRINKEQFERLYPNQNILNTQTIKVSRSDLNQLQEILKNKNEPLKQVVRLKTPNRPPSPKEENRSSPSTISVVTKGPHAGLIKRKIKKSDHQADIQKKLKEKTEYAKKLQEELEKRQKEIEEARAKKVANIQMKDKKLTRSQPQTAKQQRGIRERSASPKYENERPNSAPRKTKGKNYKKRDLEFPEEINTSSLILPSISSVSEVHPELMSPRQRNQKKKEILGRIDKLREELQQPSDPEEKRIRKAKIEAKLRQLREEFERSSDSAEREVKKRQIEINTKKLRKMTQNPKKRQTQPARQQQPQQQQQQTTERKQNVNFNQMSSAQKRKRRHEIELELQRLHEELEMTTNTYEQSQYEESEPNDQIAIERNVQVSPQPRQQSNNEVIQPRPRQIQQIQQNEQNSFSPDNQQYNYSSSYIDNNNDNNNNNSKIETEYSYSQSPIQKQQQQEQQPPPRLLQQLPPPPHKRSLDEDFQNQPPVQKTRTVNEDDDNNSWITNPTNSNTSSSLSKRRHFPNLNIDLGVVKGNNDEDEQPIERNINQENRNESAAITESDYENGSQGNKEEASEDSETVKPKYNPQKINIKKNTPPLNNNNNNNNSSQIEYDNVNESPQKKVTDRKIVEEQVVIKDGKRKKKRKIHIPISQQGKQNQSNNGNSTDTYNDNEENNDSDNQYTASENFGPKKVNAKSSSKNGNNEHHSPEKANRTDDGLGLNSKNNQNDIDLLSSESYSETTSKSRRDKPSSFLLHINVVEAKDVPSLDAFDPCDPYCLLFVEGKTDDKYMRTRSLEKTYDPVWNEKFTIIVNNEKRKKHSSQTYQPCLLNVQIKDEDKIQGDELLSSTKVDLLEFPVGQIIDQWFPLHNDVTTDDSYTKSRRNENDDTQKNTDSIRSGTSNTNSSRSNSTKKGGMIHLVLEKTRLLDEGDNSQTDEKSTPTNSLSRRGGLFEFLNGQKLVLNVTIDQASGLSKRNQYIVGKIKNSNDTFKTRAVNSAEPAWRERFVLKLPNPQEDILLITLRAKDEQNGTDDIGNILIPITSLYPPGSNQVVDKWYEFRSTSYSTPTRAKNHRLSHSSTQKMCGQIHLILGVEIDKEDSISESNADRSYSNSVTPNASSNNSAYRGSSSNNPKIKQNPTLAIYKAPNSAARHLALEIVEARDLPSKCSPLCVVQIREEKRTLVTRAVRQAPLPKWNQKCDFYSRKAIEDGTLEISIKDKRGNKEVASMSLPLEEMNNRRKKRENDYNEDVTIIDQWYPLDPVGEIHLIIIPRMKDSPKPLIDTPIKPLNQNDINTNNTRSNDEEPSVLVDASASDIDIDTQSDGGNATKRRLRRKRSSAPASEAHYSSEIGEEATAKHKRKILEQFPPTCEEE